MKQCKKCNELKDIAEFSKCSTAPDGLQRRCRACAKAYRDSRLEVIRARNRAYYAENKETILAKSRAKYKNNPEYRQQVQAGNRAWAEANPDRCKEISRAYYEANRDHLLAYQSEWAKNNRDKRREYVRRWDRANRHQHRATMAVRNKTIDRSMVAKITKTQLEQRMAYFGNKCWMCSGPFEHIDHVKPLGKGGMHILANLRPACGPCNFRKGSKWPFEHRWRLTSRISA